MGTGQTLLATDMTLHFTPLWLLQELNALPFPVTVATTTSWLAYAVVKRDPFVFAGNEAGLLLSLCYCLSAYGAASGKVMVHPSACLLIGLLTCLPAPALKSD